MATRRKSSYQRSSFNSSYTENKKPSTGRVAGKGVFPHPTHPGAESKYFPTWGDLLAFAEEHGGKGLGSSTRTGDGYGVDWCGTANMQECLHLARNGWAEGMAQAEPLCAQITDKVTSLVDVDHVVYDVEGIGLDVATYLNGEPECWQRFEKTTGEGHGVKHIRIVMDATVSGGIDKSIIVARGAAVAALIQGLEFSGCRVELEVLPLCNGAPWESRVLVKSADQDLDLSRVIFATAHPSMLRRIGFACQDGCPSRDNNSGYGPCSNALEQGDIYIGGAMLGGVQWKNPESAIKWVLEQMVKQGVALTINA